MSTGTSMTDYYQARAPEYEAVYDKPERQSDLAKLRSWLAEQARGRKILEVACGTGYWTAVAAATAQSIHATDFNSGPLEIARSKGLGPNVGFRPGRCLRAARYGRRIRLRHGAFLVVACAESRAAKVSLALRIEVVQRRRAADDRQQFRCRIEHAHLSHGRRRQHLSAARSGWAEQHEVLKNFPSTSDIEAALGTVCSTVHVLQLRHYWAVGAVLLS
jgi:SAM-dependent methyltransferase